MTPQEKAVELVDKFSKAQDEDGFINQNKHRHIQCAKIAVDEIIAIAPMYKGNINPDYEYWQEVKQELENL